MIILQIPTSSTNPHYTQSLSLGGQSYVLELRYNTRMARWLLSVYDAAEQPLLLGVPLLIDRDLGAQYPTRKLPNGSLFVADVSGAQLQPQLSSFLTTHGFFFADPSQ